MCTKYPVYACLNTSSKDKCVQEIRMKEKIIKLRTGCTQSTESAESKNNFNQNCYKTDTPFT